MIKGSRKVDSPFPSGYLIKEGKILERNFEKKVIWCNAIIKKQLFFFSFFWLSKRIACFFSYKAVLMIEYENFEENYESNAVY